MCIKDLLMFLWKRKQEKHVNEEDDVYIEHINSVTDGWFEEKEHNCEPNNID